MHFFASFSFYYYFLSLSTLWNESGKDLRNNKSIKSSLMHKHKIVIDSSILKRFGRFSIFLRVGGLFSFLLFVPSTPTIWQITNGLSFTAGGNTAVGNISCSGILYCY